MKKKALPLIALLAAALLTLGVTGCGNQNSSVGNNGGTAVAELLSKGKKVEDMSYSMTTAMPGLTTTGKFWISGKKMRAEIADATERPTVTLIDGDAGIFYSYKPYENVAVKLASKEQAFIPGQTPLEHLLAAKPDASTILKDETINGMACKVISVKGQDGQETARMWISEKSGLPIRVEAPFAGTKTKATTVYSKIVVGPVKDSVFTLPAGVKVTDISK